MESSVTVLLASDLPPAYGDLRKVLDETAGVRVVAYTEDSEQILILAGAHRPDVVILDLNLDWSRLCDLVGELFAIRVPSLLVGDAVEDVKAFELLQRGLSGILPRRVNSEILFRSLRAVSSGEVWISRRVAAQFVRHSRMAYRPEPVRAATAYLPATPPGKDPTDASIPERLQQNPFGLTRRELQMVQALGEGMTNKDIAAHFSISEYTVKHHLTRIFDKLGVYSRLELAMFATHHGLVGRDAVDSESR